jgi:hypothetical protein
MSGAGKMKMMRFNHKNAVNEAGVLIDEYESAATGEKETMEENVKKALKVVSDEQESKVKSLLLIRNQTTRGNINNVHQLIEVGGCGNDDVAELEDEGRDNDAMGG